VRDLELFQYCGESGAARRLICISTVFIGILISDKKAQKTKIINRYD